MAMSKGQTVAGYLRTLPPERRAVVSKVRSVVRRHLPNGYSESMGFGMICYGIPLSKYPKTYNGQPLCYAGLAAQKNYYALHLMGVYANPKAARKLVEGFKKQGKKLDMGKSCIRFKSVDDLALDVIAESIASTPPAKLIAYVEASRPARTRSGPVARDLRARSALQ
jgi:hypothetical protein